MTQPRLPIKPRNHFRRFWQESLPAMEYVGTYRHPMLTAMSLFKRDEMPIEYALEVWAAYNESMLEQYRHKVFPVISFNTTSDEYLAGIEKITAELKLPLPSGETFLDTKLQNASTDDNDDQLNYRAREIMADLEAAYNPRLQRSSKLPYLGRGTDGNSNYRWDFGA